MPNRHYSSAGASIEYGAAQSLFPVAELPGRVSQYRDAELALADTDGEDVIVIAPTSLATSYRLGQHPLTAIPIEGLNPAVREELDDHLEDPIESFELVQVGRAASTSPNHSLSEFVDS